MANLYTPDLAASTNQRILLTDYTTGTVAVTNGSASIVGTGTSWSTENAGARIVIGATEYQIDSVSDPTHADLTAVFAGSTASGLSYAIRDSYAKGPINAPPGSWRLIVDQDATGGHNLLFDPAAYFFSANLLGTAAASTRAQITWLHDQDGFDSLSFVITDQPIPS